MRVSMHPGQFTVLNSPRRDVVASSIQELDYHTGFLDALGIPESHKIVVHLGGVYGDKARSLDRFIQTYKALGPRVRSRLVIENDEHCYSLADALKVAQAVSVPVVFDVFHHRWNPSLPQHPLRSLVELAARTWRRRDGRPKIHYSNQWPGKAPGTHSKTIRLKRFEEFYEQIEDFDLDIMLEVKDKERSVLKVMRALGGSNRGETGTRPNHLQSKNHDHTNAPVAQAH
jgi:UV DNA damage endonuclease